MQRDSSGDKLADRILNLQKLERKYRMMGLSLAADRCKDQIETLEKELTDA